MVPPIPAEALPHIRFHSLGYEARDRATSRGELPGIVASADRGPLLVQRRVVFNVYLNLKETLKIFAGFRDRTF